MEVSALKGVSEEKILKEKLIEATKLEETIYTNDKPIIDDKPISNVSVVTSYDVDFTAFHAGKPYRQLVGVTGVDYSQNYDSTAYYNTSFSKPAFPKFNDLTEFCIAYLEHAIELILTLDVTIYGDGELKNLTTYDFTRQQTPARVYTKSSYDIHADILNTGSNVIDLTLNKHTVLVGLIQAACDIKHAADQAISAGVSGMAAQGVPGVALRGPLFKSCTTITHHDVAWRNDLLRFFLEFNIFSSPYIQNIASMNDMMLSLSSSNVMNGRVTMKQLGGDLRYKSAVFPLGLGSLFKLWSLNNVKVSPVAGAIAPTIAALNGALLTPGIYYLRRHMCDIIKSQARSVSIKTIPYNNAVLLAGAQYKSTEINISIEGIRNISEQNGKDFFVNWMTSEMSAGTITFEIPFKSDITAFNAYELLFTKLTLNSYQLSGPASARLNNSILLAFFPNFLYLQVPPNESRARLLASGLTNLTLPAAVENVKSFFNPGYIQQNSSFDFLTAYFTEQPLPIGSVINAGVPIGAGVINADFNRVMYYFLGLNLFNALRSFLVVNIAVNQGFANAFTDESNNLPALWKNNTALSRAAVDVLSTQTATITGEYNMMDRNIRVQGRANRVHHYMTYASRVTPAALVSGQPFVPNTGAIAGLVQSNLAINGGWYQYTQLVRILTLFRFFVPVGRSDYINKEIQRVAAFSRTFIVRLENLWPNYVNSVNNCLNYFCRISYLYGGITLRNRIVHDSYYQNEIIDGLTIQPNSITSLLLNLDDSDQFAGISHDFSIDRLYTNIYSTDCIDEFAAWWFILGSRFRDVALPGAGVDPAIEQLSRAGSMTLLPAAPVVLYVQPNPIFSRRWRFDTTVAYCKKYGKIGPMLQSLIDVLTTNGISILSELRVQVPWDATANAQYNGEFVRSVWNDFYTPARRGAVGAILSAAPYFVNPHFHHPIIIKVLKAISVMQESYATQRNWFGLCTRFRAVSSLIAANNVYVDGAANILSLAGRSIVQFGITGGSLAVEQAVSFNFGLRVRAGAVPGITMYDSFKANTYYLQLRADMIQGFNPIYHIPVRLSTAFVDVETYSKTEADSSVPFSWKSGSPFVNIDSQLQIGELNERFVKPLIPNSLYNNPFNATIMPRFVNDRRIQVEDNIDINLYTFVVPSNFEKHNLSTASGNSFSIVSPNSWGAEYSNE